MAANVGMGRKGKIALWVVQVLLAALFLFAGAMKFVIPIDQLEAQSGMSGLFLRFIGACEVLGALGLILPGLFRIQQQLTPLAAAGLVIIMAGATTISAAGGQVSAAVMPLVVGVLCATVVYGRARLTTR